MSTWHGLDDDGAKYGLDGDEGWFWSKIENRIERNLGCDPAPFSTNEEAIEFVRQKAEEGSELHQRAILKHITRLLTK